MNKLTITDKVFVPVTFAEELPDYLDEIYTITQGLINKGLVKEETNKYVLSKEELENLISSVVELSREGIVAHRISEWETEKEFDYTDSQIINSILNNEK
jgi:hypothetical protein